MRYRDLDEFLRQCKGQLQRKTIAAIFAEDEVEIASTLRHHQRLGFDVVILFCDHSAALPQEAERDIHRIDTDIYAENAALLTINRLMSKLSSSNWLYYGFNGEYLFYPFSETRNIHELVAFHSEERREAFVSLVIDLYTEGFEQAPLGVSRENAYFDRTGYYALDTLDPEEGYAPKERQLDFYGGLRWRFEEHVSWERRKINRVNLFRPRAGLALREDFTLSDEEMNTYACRWHNNITLAVASFRTAKALRINPGPRHAIKRFVWHGSEKFQWQSQQLMQLGLMEPGQWF